jgi:HK97 family phage major capsid protein/HK97 family phage prohead protease
MVELKQLAESVERIYSTIEIKAFDDEKREFTGIASTPATDRMNDIVEPKGAEYRLPIALLWQHDKLMPVGTVITARPTKNGIEVKGHIPKADAPAGLAARLEEAWQSLKLNLVRGLSIGFRPIEYAFLDNGGIHFTKWDWLELSLVTIPANADATILSIKSFDQQNMAAALGNAVEVPTKPSSGVSEKQVIARITKPKPLEAKNMNIQEQIKGFEESRKTKQLEMNTLMEKAAGEGRGLDASESESFDTLKLELKAIDDQITRLKDLEEINLKSATVVTDVSGMATRTTVPATPKYTEKLEKGIRFARYAMCLGAAKGDLHTAKSIAASRFPHDEAINLTLKAAVEAGTTTGTTWASPLVAYNQFAGDFIEYLRPQTIIGKFGTGGIPALRQIPFNVHIRGQSSGGTGYWVGQGAPKPLTKFDFTDAYLGFAKVANIAVLSDELVRFSNPSAEMLVRDSLAGALIGRIDTDFIDPEKSETANVSPASITNGVSRVISSGVDADAIRVDVKAAMAYFIAANITPTTGVWIMQATTALALSLMRNALGQKEFPELTMLGGTFEGLPVIVSEYVPDDSSGSYVVLVNASDIFLADDGGITIDVSREASLQMLDNPTNNSSTGTATTMVSMFQTNSVAIRAERYINWKRRRDAGVVRIDQVRWGS